MEVINVIVAAAVAWAFGAVWYSALGRQWMEASGLKPEDINRKDPVPFVVSFIGAVLVAGMMRHIYASSGITSIGGGIVAGLGMGLFLVLPWMVNNVLYAQRDRRLIWIDGGYPVIGMTLIGLVLNLF
ncbi:MAG: DUF1761 domain-containing protein [Alphaproteobacteria bacterium]|nr:MAG: DUF1761 domain-containing protein [Alphaproteobacteria bacterium]